MILSISFWFLKSFHLSAYITLLFLYVIYFFFFLLLETLVF